MYLSFQLVWLLFESFILEISIALSTLLEGVAVALISTLAWSATALLAIVLLIAATLHVLAITRFHLGIFFNHVDDFVGNSQVFDGAATNVALGHTPKSVTVLQSQHCDAENELHKQRTTSNKRILAFDVQMTSRKLMFIHVSQLTKWPLYVSPFFSSTN